MATVSIVMPVYNGSRFISEAVDSALAQTFQDWELIIVDDGSTDATPDILAQYADPRIQTIRQTNRGEAAARNAGLARTTGEFVAWLDADDVYLPNALSDFVAFMSAHAEVGVVFSDGYFCDEQGQRLLRLTEHRPGIFTGNILEPLVLSSSVITVPVCTLTRRSALVENRLCFDEGLRYGVDWDLWIRLALHVPFGYLHRPTCLYRVHQTNMTRSTSLQQRRSDLAQTRLKVFNADWFSALSLATRRQFVYHLLTSILVDQPAQQQAILNHPRVDELPPCDQGMLWRQIGIDYLLGRTETEFAVQCVQHGVQLCPSDRKGHAVLAVMQVGGIQLTVLVLRGWQLVTKARQRVRTLGRPTPKPVPAGLHPSSE